MIKHGPLNTRRSALPTENSPPHWHGIQGPHSQSFQIFVCLHPSCAFFSPPADHFSPHLSPFHFLSLCRVLERPVPSKVPPVMAGAEWLLRILSCLAPGKLFENREFITTTATLLQTISTSGLRGKSIKVDECYRCIAACKTRIMLAS